VKKIGNFDSRNYFKSDLHRLWIRVTGMTTTKEYEISYSVQPIAFVVTFLQSRISTDDLVL